MIVLVLAMFATWNNQDDRITMARSAQVASCERGNRIRRQIRIQNIILQDLLAASRADAGPSFDEVLAATLQRLRDQYNGSDLAPVTCEKEIP